MPTINHHADPFAQTSVLEEPAFKALENRILELYDTFSNTVTCVGNKSPDDIAVQSLILSFELFADAKPLSEGFAAALYCKIDSNSRVMLHATKSLDASFCFKWTEHPKYIEAKKYYNLFLAEPEMNHEQELFLSRAVDGLAGIDEFVAKLAGNTGSASTLRPLPRKSSQQIYTFFNGSDDSDDAEPDKKKEAEEKVQEIAQQNLLPVL